MAPLTSILRIAATPAPPRSTGLRLAGAIAPLALALALGGCATKAMHFGASADQDQKSSSKSGRTAGTSSGTTSGNETSSLSAAQPGGDSGSSTAPASVNPGESSSSTGGATSAASERSEKPSADSTGNSGTAVDAAAAGTAAAAAAGGATSAAAGTDGGQAGFEADARGGPGGTGERGENSLGSDQSVSAAAAAGTSSPEPSGTGTGAAGDQAGTVAGADASSGGAAAAGEVAAGPGARSGVGGGTAGMEGADGRGGDSDARVAAIDVPNSNVKVDEEYRPQTLGGMLPLVLGVNEEGRFDFDQYALRNEVKGILDQLAEKLKTAEYDRLDIVGYTDRIGTPEYNQRLSELRAWSVAQYLQSRGVPENKIHYEGRGRSDPVTRPEECTGLARDDLIACLQKDRRVEIEASIRRKHATITQ